VCISSIGRGGPLVWEIARAHQTDAARRDQSTTTTSRAASKTCSKPTERGRPRIAWDEGPGALGSRFLVGGLAIVGLALTACGHSGGVTPSPSLLTSDQVTTAGRAAAQHFFDVTSAAQRAGTVDDHQLMTVEAGDALAKDREFFKELVYQHGHVDGVLTLRIISAVPTAETPPKARVIGCVTGPANVVDPTGRKLRDAISGPTGVEYVAARSADGTWRVVSVGAASTASC
jgi:hypothetical protein